MHWNSFASNNWKWGTLKTLVRRAYETCSTDEYLRDELKHIRSMFNEINNYPHWVISKVFKEIKNKQAYQRNIFQDNNDEDQKQHLLVLSCKGHKGEQVVNSMRKRLNVVLPRNVKIKTSYTGKSLSLCFKTKDRMKFEHEHVKCPEESCTDYYIGESGRSVLERVKDHNGRDKSSHMLRNSIEKNHTEVTMNDFKVIGQYYKNNVRKQKIAGALLIKQFRPTLNVQEQSVVLKL